MIERDWISKKLNPAVKELRPDIAWFKLGDTFGGHKKPCDIMATINGETVYIEVKQENKPLTPNELMAAVKVFAAGGKYYVLRYYPDKHLSWLKYGSGEIDTFDNIEHFLTWI